MRHNRFVGYLFDQYEWKWCRCWSFVLFPFFFSIIIFFKLNSMFVYSVILFLCMLPRIWPMAARCLIKICFVIQIRWWRRRSEMLYLFDKEIFVDDFSFSDSALTIELILFYFLNWVTINVVVRPIRIHLTPSSNANKSQWDDPGFGESFIILSLSQWPVALNAIIHFTSHNGSKCRRFIDVMILTRNIYARISVWNLFWFLCHRETEEKRALHFELWLFIIDNNVCVICIHYHWLLLWIRYRIMTHLMYTCVCVRHIGICSISAQIHKWNSISNRHSGLNWWARDE